ncbi:transporter substrate-binding domain-containing protein [Roseococcus sp. DSY-14]|uniref:transporter substrate-binding domain-containing protein n=1 Tax=Roseococcus sp. DSY-14 TaxID=3369650 RepID=UPI00387AC924
MMKKLLLAAAMAAGLSSAPLGGAQAQATLDAVRARGQLACGVNASAPGFTVLDAQGRYQGMVADLCRGLAAAIFGSPDRVRFVPLTFATRFTALGAGEVDVLMLTSTHTVLRDTTLGLRFTAYYFYDGHGFMARRSANATRVRDLAGATICLQQGTTNEQITAEYFRSQA